MAEKNAQDMKIAMFLAGAIMADAFKMDVKALEAVMELKQGPQFYIEATQLIRDFCADMQRLKRERGRERAEAAAEATRLLGNLASEARDVH